MAVTLNKAKYGYGQVEPNHLSAQRTSQIYAQLPANNTDFGGGEKPEEAILENGQFVKYDYSATHAATNGQGEVNLSGKGEWMMVFNEVKLYDDRWRESYKDFAMKAKDTCDYVMVPRVIKTNIGDIYTTNAAEDGAYSVKDVLVPTKAAKGFLVKEAKIGDETDTTMRWEVVAETTMPDGSPAIKLMRIK